MKIIQLWDGDILYDYVSEEDGIYPFLLYEKDGINAEDVKRIKSEVEWMLDWCFTYKVDMKKMLAAFDYVERLEAVIEECKYLRMEVIYD